MDEKWGSPILWNFHMLPLYESADANFKFDGPLSCLEFIIEPQQNDTMEDMHDFSVASSLFEHLCNEVPGFVWNCIQSWSIIQIRQSILFLGTPTIRRFREELPSATRRDASCLCSSPDGAQRWKDPGHLSGWAEIWNYHPPRSGKLEMSFVYLFELV